MARLRVEGLPAVSRELERIRKAQAPAIAAAVEAATSFGHKLAVDEVYRRYGFRERAYVEQHLTVSFNPRTLEGRVIGRYRPSSLSRFIVRENTRTSKLGGKVVRDGVTIASIRNQPNWLKGAFTYIGRNGNRLVAERSKGDNSWRSLKGRKTLYGPSVAGSFAVIRSQIEPPIIQHLRDRYRQLAK
ncbi:hypothetical protein MJ923_07880 [Shewanella sp. 3B26]|uniref:Uncharacterized protein n=1 Tax=Shewanella zhuhaiensis TaxID=2919576 RepID=A0AAJ1BGD8_9GAMM|nr:hypothetical protein [Shewanella zhuhaiensis]MCH4294223.1 hypothetical protein [Shewanella zhuhaiensis]